MRRLLLVGVVLLLTVGCVSKKRQGRAQARVDLGAAYLKEGSTEMAIAQLEEAVRLDRRNVGGWEQLGLALLKRGAPERSEEAFRRALRLDPEAASINLNYAYLLQKTGRNEEAIEVLEVALKDLTYRQPALVLNNLGFALYEVGRHQEAEARLREATLRAPNFCQAWYNLGLAREAQDNRKGAIEGYDQVVLLCPDEAAGSYLRAGSLMLELEQPVEGCHYLETAYRGAMGTPLGDEAHELHAERCGP